MTSILRQAGGEAITVGWDRPSPLRFPPSPRFSHHTPPRTLNFDFIKLQEHLQPGGNACIMFREATSFDEARSCSARNSTGERRKKKKQRTDKVKKREETKKKEREEARKEAEKENQREKKTPVANSSHRQTTLISGY